jgi:DNA repair exonuclease SbcCD nuclease subunit
MLIGCWPVPRQEAMRMNEVAYAGLLVIGDPHLESRQPGFRKDDYPAAILDKLAWCLEYAKANLLLPAILGDLFDKPRDNPNWMLARLLDMLQGEILCLYGNHDCADPVLSEHDSLSLLLKAQRLKLIAPDCVWEGRLGGRAVVIGGSSYRQRIPERFNLTFDGGERPLVVWLTHHDILIPGYDEGRIRPFAIAGVDLVINGHIHRRLEEHRIGGTRWLTPGNISRRSRNDATRLHVPSVLRIDVEPQRYELSYVEVPHRPFDEVFHEAVVDAAQGLEQSAFVRGLAELQARRTASGAGLVEFLEKNVGQFPGEVAKEIMGLAKEVMHHGNA